MDGRFTPEGRDEYQFVPVRRALASEIDAGSRHGFVSIRVAGAEFFGFRRGDFEASIGLGGRACSCVCRRASLADSKADFSISETRFSESTQAVEHQATGMTGALPLRMPSRFVSDWLWSLVLVVVVVLTYLPIRHAGFVWDDREYITTSPCIAGLSGLKKIWTTSAADISPLTLTTFWVEHGLWGLAALPYHLVNVVLHGICAVLLWRVLRSLQVPGAWLGAALWALHPVQVESVAWISETKNPQSGVFFLLSMLFFLRWLKARDLAWQASRAWEYAFTLVSPHWRWLASRPRSC